MPIFEFECNKCRLRFDALLTGTESIEDVTCQRCGSGELSKRVTAAANYRMGSVSSPLASASRCASKSGFS